MRDMLGALLAAAASVAPHCASVLELAVGLSAAGGAAALLTAGLSGVPAGAAALVATGCLVASLVASGAVHSRLLMPSGCSAGGCSNWHHSAFLHRPCK